MTILRRSPHSIRFRRPYTTASPKRLTVGIRREDPTRIWERRCPLTPDAVHDLVHKDGVDVLVQPCERRVFTASDFIKVRPRRLFSQIPFALRHPPPRSLLIFYFQAGAKLHPTLQPAHVIVGIKETPLHEVPTDPLPAPAPPLNDQSNLVPRTHIMFSHTVKGQLYNMELLGKFLASETADAVQAGTLLPRLIDYELLTGEDGKRTVGFGWFAGGELFRYPPMSDLRRHSVRTPIPPS